MSGERQTKDYGIHLPGHVVACPGLNPYDWVVLGLIIQLTHDDRGCFASRSYLAEKLSVDERSLRRILGRLIERGLVVQVEGARWLKAAPEDSPLWKTDRTESPENRTLSPADRKSGRTESPENRTESPEKRTLSPGGPKVREDRKSGGPGPKVRSDRTESPVGEDRKSPRSDNEVYQEVEQEVNTSSAGQPAGGRARTERDDLFDAVADCLGLDPTVKGNGARVGQIVTTLLEAKPPYTPDEVRKFADVWAEKHPISNVPKPQELLNGIGMVRNPRIMARVSGLPPPGARASPPKPAALSSRAEFNARHADAVPEEARRRFEEYKQRKAERKAGGQT